MSQYKTIATTPASAPAIATTMPPAAHGEPKNKPEEPAKADYTTAMVKEKIEPGRDIFASPIKEHVFSAETAGGVDPAVLEKEKKAKEEKMRSEIEALKTKVGPLSPSEVVVKAAIEQAEFDAIVKDPSKDNSKPKEDEMKVETTPPRDEEKTEEKKAEAKIAEKPKSEEVHDKEAKDESVSSIQSAPSSAYDETEEKKKKPLSPEEIEAERVRQALYGKDSR